MYPKELIENVAGYMYLLWKPEQLDRWTSMVRVYFDVLDSREPKYSAPAFDLSETVDTRELKGPDGKALPLPGNFWLLLSVYKAGEQRPRSHAPENAIDTFTSEYRMDPDFLRDDGEKRPEDMKRQTSYVIANGVVRTLYARAFEAWAKAHYERCYLNGDVFAVIKRET